jgi:hypothetical protein
MKNVVTNEGKDDGEIPLSLSLLSRNNVVV